MATQGPFPPSPTVLPLQSTPQPTNDNFSYEFRMIAAIRRSDRVTAEKCKEINKFLKRLQECEEISKDTYIRDMSLQCSLSIKHLSFSETALGSEEISKMVERFKAHIQKTSVETSLISTISSSASSDLVEAISPSEKSFFISSPLRGGMSAPKAVEVPALVARKSRWRCC
jgi:hypothetical protein